MGDRSTDLLLPLRFYLLHVLFFLPGIFHLCLFRVSYNNKFLKMKQVVIPLINDTAIHLSPQLYLYGFSFSELAGEYPQMSH